MRCPSCRRDVCLVFQHKDCLLAELDSVDEALDSSKKRNHLYHSFVASEHEQLGARNWVRIPHCVVAYICLICPCANGKYIGFCAVGDVGDIEPPSVVEGHDYDGMPLGEKSVDQRGGDDDVEIDDDGVNSLNASYKEVENQTNNTVNFRGGEEWSLVCISITQHLPWIMIATSCWKLQWVDGWFQCRIISTQLWFCAQMRKHIGVQWSTASRMQ